MKHIIIKRIHPTLSAVVAVLSIATGTSLFAQGAILPNLSPTPTFSVSTVPSNGDLNPYGVAFVPQGFPTDGLLSPGDILVSNFNASSNVQGTGTTIVKIDSSGHQSLFFQGKNGLGLTTALGVLRGGFIIVGNLPTNTPSGMCTETTPGEETGVGKGSLLVIDRFGHHVGTIRSKHFLNGPWDLTVSDQTSTAAVFVSDVLNGAVTRLDLNVDPSSGVAVAAMTRIASGYTRRCDPAALVVGPTGLALDPSGLLYVASTGDNAIYAVPNANISTGDHGKGALVVSDPAHMHGPLGLARSGNGDLITSQGDAVNPDPNHPSEIVEYSAAGTFVAEFSIDSAPGSAFGLALRPTSNGFVFAAVDDGMNVLDIWVVQQTP
ncbi:MAG TPA: hypothetical protein VNN08_18780 [Thermoanaerobaculia bacterium]|nr:hypothetical protein [Thermoanaerobaculia bacterium]